MWGKMKENTCLKEISVTDIENIKIGHEQDYENATGCTVILCERGAVTGVDIRGGGPASRESALLNPLASNQGVHAVLLSGGSAFGLDAAGGVMEYLEERGIGFQVGAIKVPIVCESCLFDLKLVNGMVRPDKEMGRRACEHAQRNQPAQGNAGAGTGCTVGKFYGEQGWMKSGIGFYAVQLGRLKVGAVVAVNALGDVFDFETNQKLAGLFRYETGEFSDTEEAFYQSYADMENLFAGNTTIGAVITNGAFSKTEMTKIAAMAQNGFARTIRPVHTTADGDSLYGMSVGDVQADLNVVGTLAARVVAKAVNRGVLEAEGRYGLKAAGDVKKPCR